MNHLWRSSNRKIPLLLLFLSPAFFLLFSGKRGNSQQPVFDPQAIDTFITRQMAAQRVPGLALAITQGDQVLYVKAYGQAKGGQPVTAQTQFFIASVSKSFTALAVMQLVEAGKVELDSPVRAYLPEFTLADPQAAAQVTVRHLLNQTSGLSEAGFPDMRLPQPETVAERVTSLRTAPLVARPGTEYHYFSPNYGVLARLVEVVSGQPFSEYLQAHIFEPLEMAHTLSVITSIEGRRKATDLVQGHLLAFGIPFAYPERPGYLGGSGGVISTAEDMAHYLVAEANAGRYLDRALVSRDSMDTMHTPPEGIAGSYAMGWTEQVVNGRRILEHNGILSTYSAEVVLLPDEGYGITLLYNVSSFPTIAFGAPHFRNGLLALLDGRQPETGGLSVRGWGLIMAALTLAGGLLGIRSLVRLPRWAEKASTVPAWRLLPGIAWTFVPSLVLLSLPALTTRFSGRAFGTLDLFQSMIDIFTWLGLTAVLGAINGLARIWILAGRLRRSPLRS